MYFFTIQVENSVDQDQLASEKPADLDPHCFQSQDMYQFSIVWVTIQFLIYIMHICNSMHLLRISSIQSVELIAILTLCIFDLMSQ